MSDKRIALTLTTDQWFMTIEGLDNEGLHFKNTPKSINNYAKHRAHGRKMLALAKSLRRKLKGKL